jgi:hypothetical protein
MEHTEPSVGIEMCPLTSTILHGGGKAEQVKTVGFADHVGLKVGLKQFDPKFLQSVSHMPYVALVPCPSISALIVVTVDRNTAFNGIAVVLNAQSSTIVRL